MVKEDRNYRSSLIEARDGDNKEFEEFIVEGYATTFDDPYEMGRDGDKIYYEKITRDAFDDADMSDVIMQYDHEGMVFARMKNGTLNLEVDEHGLHIIADLSSTKDSRAMYEAIKSGLVTEMSWAFTVAEDSYDSKTRTRTITKIRKVYDVSAVSIPANPKTEISARNYFNGLIEEESRRELEREKEVIRLRLKMKIQ